MLYVCDIRRIRWERGAFACRILSANPFQWVIKNWFTSFSEISLIAPFRPENTPTHTHSIASRSLPPHVCCFGNICSPFRCLVECVNNKHTQLYAILLIFNAVCSNENRTYWMEKCGKELNLCERLPPAQWLPFSGNVLRIISLDHVTQRKLLHVLLHMGTCVQRMRYIVVFSRRCTTTLCRCDVDGFIMYSSPRLCAD